jgi:DNA primase
VRNVVAVCGTALTPEHVDVLKRCDCREIVVLFDGDAAGAAAPARAARALLPAGISGKVALLPAAEGKSDPDEFARANGGAAVEALVAAAQPLSEHLIERAVERHCGGAPRQAAVEAKLAAFKELRPFLALAPEGLARTMFEQRLASRLEVDLAAIVAELERPAEPPRPARAAAASVRPPSAPPPRGPRVERGSGSVVDAVGLLASFPALAAVAEEEHLLGAVTPGPLAEIVRDLVAGALGGDELEGRLAGALDAAARRRVHDLLGPARPQADHAERELRRAILKARVERLEVDYDRLNALVARRGTPVAEDLRTEVLATWRRLADLKERLAVLEKGSTPG